MKIAIIGAGAMGSLFGGRLALAGQEVWLLDLLEPLVRTIQAQGLSITTADGKVVTFPRATTNPSEIGTVDLIIVFVKATATRSAAQATIGLLGPDTAVLTLQNGYGNAEQLAQLLGAERIIAGTTAQGATLLAPGQVLHAGHGDTHIGELSGGISPRLQRIAAVLSQAGMTTIAADNVPSLIWGKLVVNVGINALTGITGLKNGQLADYRETRALVALAVQEAVAVAAAAGIELPYAAPLEKVLAIATATAPNTSSLLQDLQNCRPTEIDAINGAIVREGERLGVPTPVNQVLTLLIKTLEQITQESRR
ncbi:MAG: 2-dehydropantoate 2-reductase [Negativicutes bacterium]|nr:2-dehydropantoate 2-reductase [Negativicutes bacterium]